MRRYVVWIAVSFLAIASPVLARAAYLEVPLWRPEMLILLVALLLFSMATAALFANSRRVVRLLLLTSLAVISLDLQLGGERLITDIGHAIGYEGTVALAVKAFALLAVFGALFAAVWLLQRHIVTVLLVYLGASVAMTVATWPFGAKVEAVEASPRSSTPAGIADKAPEPPLLLHIVLDAMISPAAMERDIPGADQAYRAVSDFERRFGFRSYRQVYSRFNSTFFSLSSMFNFHDSGSDVTGILEKRMVNGQEQYRLKENRFFDHLARGGYDIRVYQYDVFDFCGHAGVVYCRSQSIYNPLDEYVSTAMDLPTGMANIIVDLAGPGSFAHSVLIRIARRMDESVHIFEHYSAHSALPLFKEMTGDVIEAPNGTAVFFHLMMPHAPFIWDEDCGPAEGDRALLEVGWGGVYGDGLINDEASRKARYGNYFKEVVCVFDRLTVMLERLEAAGRLDDALILIHGDHGSRISMADWKGNPAKLSERDLVDLHATYFAVRSPRPAAGRDSEFISLQTLFGRMFGPEPAIRETAPATHTVVIENEAPDPDDLEVPTAELPMPFFGPGRTPGRAAMEARP